MDPKGVGLGLMRNQECLIRDGRTFNAPSTAFCLLAHQSEGRLNKIIRSLGATSPLSETLGYRDMPRHAFVRAAG
jgi:hypothetical protein